MKNKGFKVLLSIAAITVVTGVFVGCGTNKEATKVPSSSSITAAGSTALQPLAEATSKVFIEKNPNFSVSVQGGGSGTGLKLVSEGTADIGNSDVTAESKLDATKAKDLVDHKVCVIGYAIVVNKDVKVDSLTKEQIQKIFAGEITNWKDLGGSDEAINVVNRTKSSGTRATFKDTIMGSKDEKDDLGTIQDSNGAVQKALASTKGTISYLALSYINDTVKKDLNIVKIDGVESSKENITTGKYGFWSYEHMYTKGEAKGATKAFIDYMISNDNKSVVEKLGYIPMGDMKVK